jgi:hypothetical protein
MSFLHAPEIPARTQTKKKKGKVLGERFTSLPRSFSLGAIISMARRMLRSPAPPAHQEEARRGYGHWKQQIHPFVSIRCPSARTIDGGRTASCGLGPLLQLNDGSRAGRRPAAESWRPLDPVFACLFVPVEEGLFFFCILAFLFFFKKNSLHQILYLISDHFQSRQSIWRDL